jgi:hypothetical protein
MGIKHGLPRSLGYNVFMVWSNLWKGWKNENGQMQDFITNLLGFIILYKFYAKSNCHKFM